MTNIVLGEMDKLKELFRTKQEQYAGDDPLQNFRTAARLKGLPADEAGCYEIAKDYMAKHVAHIYGHDIDAIKADESLGDIVNYCLIMIAMIRMRGGRSER